jgi:Tol biopolymer transport system component
VPLLANPPLKNLLIHRRMTCGIAALLLAALCLMGTPAKAGAMDLVEVASRSSNGGDSNGNSDANDMSASGRYIAFRSSASNLVEPAPHHPGIFVRDRVEDITEQVTVTIDGQAPGWSTSPSISGNGRYVTFYSNGSNLVEGDEDYGQEDDYDYDVFLRDTVADETSRISMGVGGNPPNGRSDDPEISNDGRFIVFASNASNLVTGDDNGARDIFLYDIVSETTALVSVNRAGEQLKNWSFAPSVSNDGRFVAFEYLRDVDRSEVLLFDRASGTTRKISRAHGGGAADGSSSEPSISSGGRFTAFSSDATNMTRLGDSDDGRFADIFVFDRRENRNRLVSIGGLAGRKQGQSASPSISADGRFVSYESTATDIVHGDPDSIRDVYLARHLDRSTRLVSRGSCDEKSNAWSLYPNVSRDGEFVSFASDATNVVPNDVDDERDIYVRNMTATC